MTTHKHPIDNDQARRLVIAALSDGGLKNLRAIRNATNWFDDDAEIIFAIEDLESEGKVERTDVHGQTFWYLADDCGGVDDVTEEMISDSKSAHARYLAKSEQGIVDAIYERCLIIDDDVLSYMCEALINLRSAREVSSQ